MCHRCYRREKEEMSSEETYKRRHVFAIDFGTSDLKYGPISLGEVPEVVQNRGYIPDRSSIMYRLSQVQKEVIVGRDLPMYLEAREDLPSRLIYPMRNGIIDKDDDRAWRVAGELIDYTLSTFKPADPDFRGFYVIASLSSITPRYMYERFFELFKGANRAQTLVRAVTIITQPLAVAISHKILTCVVLESGHGNTQICPISRYPIRNAILAINRGGGDGNIITSEILKDCGYGDLVQEEALVRKVKENLGLVPRDLEEAIRQARASPERFRAAYKVEGTRITIDLAENSWLRFLIGEYVFDPNNEVFQSYFTRGMPKPKDAKIGDISLKGMLNYGDAVAESVERCPIELQPYLYKQILLSGGNFSWKVPEELGDVAVDARTKVKTLLERAGVSGAEVKMAESPQFSVWRGALIYGYAVPSDYAWNWERMEGWVNLGG